MSDPLDTEDVGLDGREPITKKYNIIVKFGVLHIYLLGELNVSSTSKLLSLEPTTLIGSFKVWSGFVSMTVIFTRGGYIFL